MLQCCATYLVPSRLSIYLEVRQGSRTERNRACEDKKTVAVTINMLYMNQCRKREHVMAAMNTDDREYIVVMRRLLVEMFVKLSGSMSSRDTSMAAKKCRVV